jgi:hypothetical protein
MTIPQSASVNAIELSAGRFDTAHGSDAAALAKLFSNIQAAAPKKLVIHFHGGLVSRESALTGAEQLAPAYKNAGAESLFVVWETGALEIVQQNLSRIVNEPIFQSILTRATEFVKGKLDKAIGPAGSKGISDLPRTYGSEIDAELEKGKRGEHMFEDVDLADLKPEQAPDPDQALTDQEREYIEREIESDDDIKMHARAIANARAEPGSKGAGGIETTLMDPEILAEIVPTPVLEGGEASKSILASYALGKHVVVVVGTVIWRFATRRDHGIYLTIVEEIMREFYVRAAGRFLWTEMKAAVDSAFEKDPQCGGTALVKELQDLWKTSKPCVTLVGHSAGSIYIARLLKELKVMDPDFKVNVALIAPACTFTVFADALANAGNRIANLRVFGMSDPVERQDHLVPGIFPASLLYFVAGVLEDSRDEPLLGMQRYYSYNSTFTNIANVMKFNLLVRQHAYAWSQVSGFDGANCDMIHHGGWAAAPATLGSIVHLIQGDCPNAW